MAFMKRSPQQGNKKTTSSIYCIMRLVADLKSLRLCGFKMVDSTRTITRKDDLLSSLSKNDTPYKSP